MTMMTHTATHHIARELDVRTLPPAERSAALLAAFDGVLPGETLVIVDARDPRPFLRQLQTERQGGS